MSLKGKEHIFQSISQHIDIDPASIKLLEDRLLIRELADDEKVGSIVIPEDARGKARYRQGIVVATGPGNRFREHGITEDGQVLRTLITTDKDCPACAFTMTANGVRTNGSSGKRFNFMAYCLEDCPACHGTAKVPLTVPCSCKPGNRVLFDRRLESQVFINGQSFFIVYEEQALIGIFTKWVCGGCGADSHEPAVDELVTCAACGISGCREVPA